METVQTTQRRKIRKSGEAPLPKTSKHLSHFLQWAGGLNNKSIRDIHQYYARDAFFKDPFTELYKADDIKHYYERTMSRVSDLHFVFENIAEEGRQAFVSWVMTARIFGKEFAVQGTSHFKFDSNGLCEYHRDYFDLSTEIYEHLPMVGAFFRGLKRVLN